MSRHATHGQAENQPTPRPEMLSVVELALRSVLARKPRLVLSPNGDILHYNPQPGRQRLGRLERRILKMLLFSPGNGAALARSLRTWHQNVHSALRRLEGKGLVKSTGYPGQNLERTPILRRFYVLNPDVVTLATQLPETSQDELQQAAATAQTRGLLREEINQAHMKLISPDPAKHYEGHRQLTQLRRRIDEILKDK